MLGHVVHVVVAMDSGLYCGWLQLHYCMGALDRSLKTVEGV